MLYYVEPESDDMQCTFLPVHQRFKDLPSSKVTNQIII